MNLARIIKYAQLSYFSHPLADRPLYRAIRKHQPRRIVEIGIGDGERMGRMIELAKMYLGDEPLHYTGVDLFEARPSEAAGLTFKQAHRSLAGYEVRGQLIPGDPFMALSRWANSLADNDFVVISADQPAGSLQQAWFYFPRMLHADSVVFQEVNAVGGKAPTRFEAVTSSQIRELAKVRSSARAA